MTRTSTSMRLGAADALEAPLLQTRSSLACMVSGHVADLVEEDRAAVGQLEAAAALADGAGERALLVAEQLALQQRLRQGGAVDRARAGRCGVGDAWWMARATCSLPVPVSPSISTVVLVWATLLISSKTACICGFLLRMFWNE